MESCERECSYRSGLTVRHQKVEEKEHEGGKRLESASSSQRINRGWDEGDEFSPEQAQHLEKKPKSATPTPRQADGELQGWCKYSCTYTYGRSVSLPTVSPSEARRTLSPLTPSCSPLDGGNNRRRTSTHTLSLLCARESEEKLTKRASSTSTCSKASSSSSSSKSCKNVSGENGCERGRKVVELRVRCDAVGEKRTVDGDGRQTDAEREKEGECWRNDHPKDRLEEESEYQYDDEEEEETFIVNVSSTFMNAEQPLEGKEEKRVEEPRLHQDLHHHHHQVKESPCTLSDPAFPESSSCRRARHDPPTIITNSFGSVSPIPTELSFLYEKEFTATTATTTTTEGSDKTKKKRRTQQTERGRKKTESGSSSDLKSLRDTTSLSDAARPFHSSFNSRHQSSMSCQLSMATLAQIDWVRKHLKAKSNTANDEDGGDETVTSDHGVRGPRYRKRKEMKNKEKRETKESAGSSLSSSSSLHFSSAEFSLSDDHHGQRETEVDWSASPLSRYLKLMSPTNTTTRARSVPTQPSTNSPQRQQERKRRGLTDCDDNNNNNNNNNNDDDDDNDVDSMNRNCAEHLPPSDDGRSIIVINGSICLRSSFLAIEKKEERESAESLLYPRNGVPPPTAATASPQPMVILMLNLFSGSESGARRAVEVEEERDRSQFLEVAFVKMSVAELGRLASGLLTENASLRKRLKAASKKKNKNDVSERRCLIGK